VLPEVEGGAEVGPQTRRPSPALSTGSLATVRGSYTCERVEATRPKGRRFRAASVVSSLRGLLRRRFGRDPSGDRVLQTHRLRRRRCSRRPSKTSRSGERLSTSSAWSSLRADELARRRRLAARAEGLQAAQRTSSHADERSTNERRGGGSSPRRSQREPGCTTTGRRPARS
jgi:hypothetical protein